MPQILKINKDLINYIENNDFLKLKNMTLRLFSPQEYNILNNLNLNERERLEIFNDLIGFDYKERLELLKVFNKD